MYSRTILAALLSASLVAAQTPTLSVLIDADEAPWVASIVDASKAATTMVVNCREGTDGSDCGAFPGGFTITQAPASWVMYYSAQEDQTTYVGHETCLLNSGKDDYDCTMKNTEVFKGKTTTTQDVQTGGYKEYVQPVTVTAGADKLDTAATKTDAPQTTETGQSQAHTDTETGKETAKDTAKETGKNAGAMATGNPVLVGVAALGALVL